MLAPRYLDGLSDELIEIYSQLETDILQDMARRIARLGKVTDSTKWQAQMLAEAGGLKKDVSRILKDYDKAIVQQIQETVTQALVKNAANDNIIFQEATGRKVSAPTAQQMLATIQKCHSDLERLTLTTAATTQSQFVKQANRVYMDVQSGAFDYDSAMKSAADELSKRGITTVQYENGKPVTRTIESAVRMNILTSINQTAANQTLNNCEELECDLVETSAHIGARPEHEEWQGQIFSRSGNNKKYRPFSVCELGSVTGICGINCKHSFYPYFEGMENHYTEKELDAMAGEKVTFEGRDMTRYEGEQYLRAIERNIRKYKRQALTQEAAGVDSTKARRKIGEWQAVARDFTKQTGIARDRAREYVGTTGKQPQGIKPQLQTTKNLEVADTLFPGEKWEEKSSGLFVAKSRNSTVKNEIEKLKKEISQAEILSGQGHVVYLPPEIGENKHFDAIVDGRKTELKTVTGNIRAVGERFRDALKQGDDIFIRTSNKVQREIYSKLIGETKTLIEKKALTKTTGNIYVWIDNEKKLYKWDLSEIIKIAKDIIKKQAP
ncbi:MAG: phage minor capsid protein [Treponemataceae bacterium]|nr:phage minor capsid protein [Treponemataceae bacterium]